MWDLNTDKAQPLGLSAGMEQISPKDPMPLLFFFVLFFLLPSPPSLFSPFFFSFLNLAVRCGGGRRISKPLSLLLVVPTHHCCYAMLERVAELECLYPPSSHPSRAGKGSAVTAAARDFAHKPFSAFSIPKRRDDATWTDAGRANSPCDL